MAHLATKHPSPDSRGVLRAALLALHEKFKLTPPLEIGGRPGVPEPFSREQVQWVMALHTLNELDRDRAHALLWDFVPRKLSFAQAACAQDLLTLSRQEARATLTDALAC